MPGSSSRMAAPRGSFPMYPGERQSPPPMCVGQRVFRILGKSSNEEEVVVQTEQGEMSGSCMDSSRKTTLYRRQRYEEVTGAYLSPDTDSSTTSSGGDISDKGESPAAAWEYIAQFSPASVELIEENEQVEVRTPVSSIRQRRLREREEQKLRKHQRRQELQKQEEYQRQQQEQKNQQQQEEQQRQRQRQEQQQQQQEEQQQQPSAHKSWRSPPWSSTLPSVAEASVETEDHSEYQDSLESPRSGAPGTPRSMTVAVARDNPGHSPDEKNEMLLAMRKLVLKQQTAIKELAEQNLGYRKELKDFQYTLIEMKQQQDKQQSVIEKLTIEKETVEVEASLLREELKNVQSQLDSLKSENRAKERFQTLMEKSLNVAVVSMSPKDEKEESEIDAYQQFKKAIMADETYRPILDEAKVIKITNPMDTNRGPKQAAVEKRDDVASRSLSEVGTRDELNGSNSRVSFATAESTATKNSREEIALFKDRLERIQQKRMMRRRERNRTVRFGATVM